MFLLVLAYPGCPGSKAVKRSLLSLLFSFDDINGNAAVCLCMCSAFLMCML